MDLQQCFNNWISSTIRKHIELIYWKNILVFFLFFFFKSQIYVSCWIFTIFVEDMHSSVAGHSISISVTEFFLVSCNFSLWSSMFRYIQIISVMIPWHIHRCCSKLHFCFEFLHPSFPLKRIKHWGDGWKAFKELYDYS